MNDTIMKINGSVLQHGNYNDRIYLMKLKKDDVPSITSRLDVLARSNGYSKIIAKVPEFALDTFLKQGYEIEACVPRFINGNIDVYFMGKYLSDSRKFCDRSECIEQVLDIAGSKANEGEDVYLSCDFEYRRCDLTDGHRIANVYKQVFETYPFPINDPEYIHSTMKENFVYFSIWRDERIVALSSAEIDADSLNAEMTDFATLPEYRGNGFAAYLLRQMENEMKRLNIKVTYTIARSGSMGINIIFAKAGYTYSGTLLNNTNIYGNLESMNVWYKHLT